jgi:hypothetical protein
MPSSGETTSLFVYLRLFRVFPTVYRRIGCSGEQGPEGLFDREGEGLASTINY